ncbi:hypothetical protein ARMGADRAFT_1078479 [Armillaria gallica]|uniref:Uncharacterized protein n=1 Tax=Armillaria gallica TaxID=47427 RepID=A0A2H3DL64_ARMGA|nr:hypothetical protein ARMGADRAFT_1078479 [Armillaria gallica]
MNTSDSPHTLIIVAAPSLAYMPWTMSNTASYFPSVSAIQSKRRKKLSIIVDWDSGRCEDGRNADGAGQGLAGVYINNGYVRRWMCTSQTRPRKHRRFSTVAEYGNVPNVFVDTVSWREEVEHTRKHVEIVVASRPPAEGSNVREWSWYRMKVLEEQEA